MEKKEKAKARRVILRKKTNIKPPADKPKEPEIKVDECNKECHSCQDDLVVKNVGNHGKRPLRPIKGEIA